MGNIKWITVVCFLKKLQQNSEYKIQNRNTLIWKKKNKQTYHINNNLQTIWLDIELSDNIQYLHDNYNLISQPEWVSTAATGIISQNSVHCTGSAAPK